MRASIGRRPARSIQHYAALKQDHGRIAQAAARARTTQPLDTKLMVRVPKPVLRELTAVRRPLPLQQVMKPAPRPTLLLPQREIVVRQEATPAARPVIILPVRPAPSLTQAYWPSHRRWRPITPSAPMPV